MAKLTDIIAELQTYYIDNWTNTPFKLDGVTQTFNGTINSGDAYIELRYVPDPDVKRIDLTRVTSFGTLQVYCYATSKMGSINLADDVIAFGSELDLPLDVHTKYGAVNMTAESDSTYWYSLVHFPVQASGAS